MDAGAKPKQVVSKSPLIESIKPFLGLSNLFVSEKALGKRSFGVGSALLKRIST
jgi:hypothetical protein